MEIFPKDFLREQGHVVVPSKSQKLLIFAKEFGWFNETELTSTT